MQLLRQRTQVSRYEAGHAQDTTAGAGQQTWERHNRDQNGGHASNTRIHIPTRARCHKYLQGIGANKSFTETHGTGTHDQEVYVQRIPISNTQNAPVCAPLLHNTIQSDGVGQMAPAENTAQLLKAHSKRGNTIRT